MSNEPLWDWFRIDEEMDEQYKAHGNTYQFIWVRYLLRKMADEYEDKLAAERAAWDELMAPIAVEGRQRP